MCGISPGPGPAGPESGPIFEEFTGPGPASKTLVPSKWPFFKKNWVFGSRKLDFSHTCSNNYFIKFAKWTSSAFPNFYKIFGFFQKNIHFLRDRGSGPGLFSKKISDRDRDRGQEILILHISNLRCLCMFVESLANYKP